MTERPAKASTAFRTISEVAEELGVAPHVLRFWESKFSQVRPLKRGGGRRYYRPEDVEVLRQIRVLLYDRGYTIKGAQKLLRQRRGRALDPSEEVAAMAGEETRTGVRDPAALVRLARDLRRLAADLRRELEG